MLQFSPDDHSVQNENGPLGRCCPQWAASSSRSSGIPAPRCSRRERPINWATRYLGAASCPLCQGESRPRSRGKRRTSRRGRGMAVGRLQQGVSGGNVPHPSPAWSRLPSACSTFLPLAMSLSQPSPRYLRTVGKFSRESRILICGPYRTGKGKLAREDVIHLLHFSSAAHSVRKENGPWGGDVPKGPHLA